LGGIRKSAKEFVSQSFVFTISFFVPYLIGLVLFGPTKALQVLANETSISHSGMILFNGTRPVLDIVQAIPAALFEFAFPGRAWLVAALAAGIVPILAYRKIRREKDPPPAYALLLLPTIYTLLYALFIRTFYTNIYRILLPLVPLLILSIVYWYSALLRQLPFRHAPLAAPVFLAALFLLLPKVGLHDWASFQSSCRVVYDTLGTVVDGNSRLLIAPASLRSYDRGFQDTLYFGGNADYQAQLPLEGPYNPETLKRALDGRRFRYVFIGNDINPVFLDPRRLIDDRGHYRTWLRNPAAPYLLAADLAMLHDYIRSRNGSPIHRSRFGTIYQLDRENATPGPKSPGGGTSGFR
ncbi:MAG TPA: hypothetical protein PKK12_01055, partial [Candidatus Aminicenantes bacterium]|nr:hypothetical protein [Candidatus Aminicenantes bacterium]